MFPFLVCARGGPLSGQKEGLTRSRGGGRLEGTCAMWLTDQTLLMNEAERAASDLSRGDLGSLDTQQHTQTNICAH